MKKTVTLDIAGNRYRMTSDADDTHLERLATLINERVAALGPQVKKAATPAQLLAVVALGLADELVQSEQRRKEIERSTKDAVGRALTKIDAVLAQSVSKEA